MRIVQDECSKHDIKFLELKYTIPRSASSSQQYFGVYGDQVVDYIGYADDLAMVFDSIASLIKGLEILNNVFKRFGLIINETKTKTMLLNFKETEENSCELRENNLDCCDLKGRYL